MRFAVLLFALLFAPAAAAQDYDAAPAVSATRQGDGAQAQATMDVDAPAAAVWAILSDCAQARRFMRRLISCRVLQQGEGWDVREHRVNGWPLRSVMRNVARVDLVPNRRLSFRRVDGDWTQSDGEWVLTPIDGGRGTHVQYRVVATLDGPLPASFSRSLLINNVRATLSALRREAERQAGSS